MYIQVCGPLHGLEKSKELQTHTKGGGWVSGPLKLTRSSLVMTPFSAKCFMLAESKALARGVFQKLT